MTSSASSSSLLPVILHHLRLCWHCLATFLFGHTAAGGSRRSSGSGIHVISLSTLFQRSNKSSRQLITFDNGIQVRIGNRIAEGGFSYVFEAFPVAAAAADTGDREKKFALKRINCANSHELIQSCRHEAGIHRSLPLRHPNLLELLGLKFDSNHGQVIAEVTTSLIINYMQPTVYQTKADDLPQRMMWVELYLMGDNTV
jgi:hypothetical protein